MTHLPNAPLVYTLGLVRFPPIPEMERFVPPFHDAIRGNYPHLDESQLQQMQFNFDPAGASFKQVPLTFWQFASPDRKIALVLSPNSLALHTCSYNNHQTFIDGFKGLLSSLVHIPGIGIEWVDGVAMRYIDLVMTKPGQKLEELLKPSILPPPFTDVADLEIVEGFYMAQYRTPKAVVRFQAVRNPPSVLPPDINTPLIALNKWEIVRPETEFAVVDTDCSVPFAGAIPMDVDAVCAHMYDLRFVAKAIFLKIGTEYAEKLWKGETE